jgi:molecular chaperone DnaJ
MAPVKDYYDILGLKKGASPEDVKSAYRKLARKHHPDVNPGDKAAEERFKEINEAYAVLGDPKKREEYDRFGKSPFEGTGWTDAPPFEDIFEFGFGDIFSDIFGAGARGAEGRAWARGADMVAGVEVTLEEAFTGVAKRMTLSREVPCTACGSTGVESSETCGKCGGSGRIQTSKGFFRLAQTCPGCGGAGRKVTKSCDGCGGRGKTYRTESTNVKIPAGVDSGSTVVLRGMGNAGIGGGPSGDLRLKVTVKPHPLFERRERDIYMKLPLTFGEAVLGAKVEVPTLDGKTKMTIPSGTQGGQRFKLSGKGFVSASGGPRGNMYLDAEIAVPRDLDKGAREAVKRIGEAYGEDPRKGMLKK